MIDYPRKAYLKVEVVGDVYRHNQSSLEDPPKRLLVVRLPPGLNRVMGYDDLVDTMEVDPDEVSGSFPVMIEVKENS